jgi:hypothetical protein
MLDLISVFSKHGAVLWSQEYAPLKSNLVHAVIHTILLEVCRIAAVCAP